MCLLFHLTFWLFKQDLNISNRFRFKFSYRSHACSCSLPRFPSFIFASFFLRIFLNEKTNWQIIILLIIYLLSSSPNIETLLTFIAEKVCAIMRIPLQMNTEKKSCVFVVYDVLIWNAMQMEPNTSTKTQNSTAHWLSEKSFQWYYLYICFIEFHIHKIHHEQQQQLLLSAFYVINKCAKGICSKSLTEIEAADCYRLQQMHWMRAIICTSKYWVAKNVHTFVISCTLWVLSKVGW